MEVLISKEDLPKVNSMPNTWGITEDKAGRKYCVCYLTISPGKRKKVYLHKYLTGESTLEVDHINSDSLNNTRNNLRPVTHQENARNMKPRPNGIPRGIYKTPSGKWEVNIGHNLKTHFLGTYPTLEEAIIVARDFRDTHWA